MFIGRVQLVAAVVDLNLSCCMQAIVEARQSNRSKSQIGRWRGLDEDVSDDQVSCKYLTVAI